MLNKDYREMLQCLADAGVKFILVGAYAVAAHGYPRATMDIDIWVMPSAGNAEAVLKALRRFGAPLHGLSRADLQKDVNATLKCIFFSRSERSFFFPPY